VHPDLLGALARQHHADLLGRHNPQAAPECFTSTRPQTARRAFRRVRHFVGGVLIATGQRLLPTTSSVADLSDVGP
jgi:hypothetical protein